MKCIFYRTKKFFVHMWLLRAVSKLFIHLNHNDYQTNREHLYDKIVLLKQALRHACIQNQFFVCACTNIIQSVYVSMVLIFVYRIDVIVYLAPFHSLSCTCRAISSVRNQFRKSRRLFYQSPFIWYNYSIICNTHEPIVKIVATLVSQMNMHTCFNSE